LLLPQVVPVGVALAVNEQLAAQGLKDPEVFIVSSLPLLSITFTG
jgi:hypothetical protein